MNFSRIFRSNDPLVSKIGHGNGIEENFSLYLDVIRITAAVAVFFDHLTSPPFTDGVIWEGLGSYGAIAVTIFFILSGYVIAFVVATKERDALSYSISRFSRMYSVALIALIITFALDTIGQHLNPSFYEIPKVLMSPPSATGYLASLFFLNEYQFFNFEGIAPGSNGPYWSLSFEVFYYIVAGIFLFSRRSIAIPTALFLMVLAGKTIIFLLPLWVIGFCLYFYKTPKLSVSVLIIVSFISLLGLISTPLLALYLPDRFFDIYFPYGRGPFERNVIKDYLAGLFFITHIMTVRSLLSIYKISIHNLGVRAIRWLGELTFPIYLMHFPLLAFTTSISPWKSNTWNHLLFISLITLISIAILTPTTNLLKNRIRTSLRCISVYFDLYRQKKTS